MKMLTTTRRGIAAVAVLAATVTGLSACGSSSPSGDGTPKGVVVSAIENLGDENALTFTLKLDTSADDVKRLAASGPDPSTLTDAQAKAIADGSVVLAVKTTATSFKAAQSDPNASKKSSVGFTLNAGDKPKLIEFRAINGDLYARVDFQKLASYGDSDLSELQSKAQKYSSTLPFLKPALAGGWLKIPADDLQQLLKASGGARPAPSIDPSRAAGIQQAILGVLDKDVTATKADDGGDLGDHYVLSGSSRVVATDLVNALKPQFAGLPGFSKAFGDANPADVPDKNVKVDVYLKGSKLNAIKLDLAQFASPADAPAFNGKPFYLELDIDDSASISTPSDATDVNLGALLGGLIKAS